MDKLTGEQRRYIQELFDEMQKKLYNYALRYLKNEDLAMDVLQETFLTVCEKPDETINSDSPQGYVFNTLKNMIRSELREITKANRWFVQENYNNDGEEREPVINRVPAEESYFFNAEYADAVKEDDYKILKLVDVDGFSIAEAAEELGISKENCKKRVQRARERMKNSIE